jgi:hypothetical protein
VDGEYSVYKISKHKDNRFNDFIFHGLSDRVGVTEFKRSLHARKKQLYYLRVPGIDALEEPRYRLGVKPLRPIVHRTPFRSSYTFGSKMGSSWIFGPGVYPTFNLICVKTLRNTKLMEQARLARKFRVCSQLFEGVGYDPFERHFYVQDQGQFVQCHDTFKKDNSLQVEHHSCVIDHSQIMDNKVKVPIVLQDEFKLDDATLYADSIRRSFVEDLPFYADTATTQYRCRNSESYARKRSRRVCVSRDNHRTIANARHMLDDYYRKNPHLCRSVLFRRRLNHVPLRRDFGSEGCPFANLAYRLYLVDHLVRTRKLENSRKNEFYYNAVLSCAGDFSRGII